MGEWNEWMPEIMDRYSTQEVLLDPTLANTFFYTAKLFRGFKYRYSFNVGEEFIVDSSKATSEDRYGKMTNFIDVLKPGETPIDHILSEVEDLDEDEIDEEELKDTMDDPGNNIRAAKTGSLKVKGAGGNANLRSMPTFIQEMKQMLPADIVKK